MMRVNQINSQESAITIGCGFFYYLFKDYRELVCFEITQCDWLMFATDVFERLSINRAWGEHKMCWTLHFKKFWGWNRHRSLSQSCRISSRINELPWLPIYHYRFSHIHPFCRAWCLLCSPVNGLKMHPSPSGHIAVSNRDEMSL